MAAQEKPKSSKKSKSTTVLYDVAKPGETPADSTSRPVIVGHKSTIKQDPMFKEPGDEPEAARPARGKDLTPLSEDSLLAEESTENQPKDEKKSDTPEPEAEEAEEFTLPVGLDEEPTPEVVPEEGAEKSTKEPESKSEPEPELVPEPKEAQPVVEKKPEKPKEESSSEEVSEGKDEKSTEEASDDEVKKTKDSVDAKEQAEQDARNAEVQKLVNSKEFFVPIGQVSRRRSSYTIVILLILVIIAAAISINFAVDAEIIEIGIEPLTDFL